MSIEDRSRARDVLRQAKRHGRDPIESLDRAGLLLTGEQFSRIKGDLCRELAQNLENTSIADLLKRHGSGSQTAYDAQRVIVELLRQAARKEGS